jgi:acyl-CoA thioesterase
MRSERGLSEAISPFEKRIGVKILEAKKGYAKTYLKITEEHLNAMGVAHGGAIFTLADAAFANAANYGSEEAVAIQANISFMKPTRKGENLTAEAVKVSESRKIGFYNITVTSEQRAIAFFTGVVYRIK